MNDTVSRRNFLKGKFSVFVIKSQLLLAVYWFPIVTLTNYWKLVNLSCVAQDNTNLLSYSCAGQKSTANVGGLKLRCWQGCVPFQKTKKGECRFFYLFRPLEAACVWLVHGPLPFPKPAMTGQVFLTSLCFVTPLPSPSTSQNPCDCTGPTWIISLS